MTWTINITPTKTIPSDRPPPPSLSARLAEYVGRERIDEP